MDLQRLWHIWNMTGPDLALSIEICKLLKDNQYPNELDIFLRNLPAEDEYLKDETLNRARIYAAFSKKDFDSVYKIIKENSYKNGEDLIDIWDSSHYFEEEIKRQKPLTPLARFRLRQRNMPPKSILPSGKRKKTTLPKESKQLLQTWLEDNHQYPYPTRNNKQILAEQTGLSIFQVSTWFANARRKLYRKLRNEVYNTVATKPIYKNRRRKGRKTYRQLSLKNQPEDLPADNTTNVRWYPGNQISPCNCSCYATESGLPCLVNKVNHCMSSALFSNEYKEKREWSSKCVDISNFHSYPFVTKETVATVPSSETSDDDNYKNVLPGNELQDAINDNAAKILVDLSNTFYK